MNKYSNNTSKKLVIIIIIITWQFLRCELTSSGSVRSEFHPLLFPKSHILASFERSSVVSVSELKLMHGTAFVYSW